jgi:hypothetical protein
MVHKPTERPMMLEPVRFSAPAAVNEPVDACERPVGLACQRPGGGGMKAEPDVVAGACFKMCREGAAQAWFEVAVVFGRQAGAIGRIAIGNLKAQRRGDGDGPRVGQMTMPCDRANTMAEGMEHAGAGNRFRKTTAAEGRVRPDPDLGMVADDHIGGASADDQIAMGDRKALRFRQHGQRKARRQRRQEARQCLQREADALMRDHEGMRQGVLDKG